MILTYTCCDYYLSWVLSVSANFRTGFPIGRYCAMSRNNSPPPPAPPMKVASIPDLTAITTAADGNPVDFWNSRKRQFPRDSSADEISSLIDEKFKSQSDSWNSQINGIITETMTTTFQSVLTNELIKITDILSNINKTMISLQADNASFKDSFKAMGERLSEMDRSLSASNERQESFENRLQILETRTSTGQELPEQVLVLENKLAAMEQQARECNIEINNLPERRSENLVSIVVDLGKLVGQKISPAEIVAVHRVPHANMKDARPKNIIVKFATKILRDNLVSACRAKKIITSEQLSISGSSQKIYVNEHLTLKNKQLFRETREKARAREFKYVWVKHGVVLARKTDTSPVIAVRSLQDIDKLKS